MALNCYDCGLPGTDTDPIGLVRWDLDQPEPNEAEVHLSHTKDEDSGFYEDRWEPLP